MKQIALFFILLASQAILSAQEASRFSTDGASVVWQAVYQTPLDSAEVAEALIGTGKFDGIVQTKDGFTCRIIPHEVDYRGAGRKRGNTAMYILGGDMEGRAVVQIREGRYRVTVDGMVFITKISGGVFVVGERESLELYALNRKGEFRNNFWNEGSSPVLDYDLFSMFEIKERTAQDEDW